MKVRAIFLIALVLTSFLSGCIDQSMEGDAMVDESSPISPAVVGNISAIELEQMLENKNFFLLDVHTPEQEHIEGTDASIPFDEIEQNLDLLPADMNTPIIVYCRSGNMSLTAAQKLIELGYTNILNLDGGIKAFNAIELQAEEDDDVPDEDANPESGDLPVDEGSQPGEGDEEVTDFYSSSLVQGVIDSIIPTGTPFYGDENISFDKPNESLKFFENVDAYKGKRQYSNTIILEGEELERYNRVSPHMYCEFCCGPVTIENCGCNHAAAYRGVAKYLIRFHGDALSDDAIIAEQVKWKNLWFQKGAVVKELKVQNKEGLVSQDELDQLLGMVGGC